MAGDVTIEERVGLPLERCCAGRSGNFVTIAFTAANIVSLVFVFKLLLTQCAQAH